MTAACLTAPPQPAASTPERAGVALDTSIVSLAEARDALLPWRRLFQSCAAANPFYGPDLLLPLLEFDPRAARLRFVLVRQGQELLGLAPILPGCIGVPGLWRQLSVYNHPFIFNSLPLLRCGFEAQGWAAMLEKLAASYGGGVLGLGPSPLDGPVVQGLRQALAQSGRAHLVTAQGERAALAPADGKADALLAAIKGKTMGKLRRHERDLGKLGKLEFRAADRGPALAEAVEDFMALEARGWKGRQGTAFASDAASAAFARRALGASQGAPGVRVETLRLDGRPIGACLHLAGPGYAATFKIAYEEELARHGPGVLAMLGSLRLLGTEAWTQRLDSGASGEDAVGAIWRDRLPSGEMLIALAPRQGEASLRLHGSAVALAERARRGLRDAYYAVTRRRRTLSRKAKG